METTYTLQKIDIIKESLKHSMTYNQYCEVVNHLATENSNTGNEKNKALANYTKLNDRRMKRWNKTVKISEAIKDEISRKTLNQTWLVISESWCGDAANVIPAINKIAELNEGIDLKIVLRDENDALMNEFLTNGGKSIPKLIMIDNTSETVVNSYGPRPTEATKMVNDFKAEHGALTAEFKEDLQRWYNKDKGQNVISDLLELIN